MTEKLIFTDPTFPYSNYPFPNNISNDPMVLYHSSSSCFEEEIQTGGLRTDKIHFTLKELVSIAEVFKSLGWMGENGSMTTLQPFSIAHDNKKDGLKPIFLGSCSFAVVGYARYQNSGGEIAKAVRYCFQDLYKFLNDVELRKKHQASIEYQIHQAQSEGRIYEPPTQEITLEELEITLAGLEHINKRAISLIENTDYGIVYAIKFEEEDMNNLLYHNFMGIKYFCDIPPSKIVAKAIVPKDYFNNRFSSFLPEKIPSWVGIMSKIKKE